MPPATLYYVAIAGRPDAKLNADRILRFGVPAENDFVTLFGNVQDAKQLRCETIGYALDDPSLVVIEVNSAGLPIDRYPSPCIFIDITGDAWFCHTSIPPDHLKVFDATARTFPNV